MKTNNKVAIALVAGAAIGGAAIQGLHAQAKPIAYVVAEVDVTNSEGYTKEFLPLATKALSDGGSGFKVVAGGKNVTIEGTPPKARYVIASYENMDKAIAAYNSPAFKEARKIGDKYASSFRIIAVEAPQ
ncbi:DUF1330 domain-containing protein [Trinickia violacea]|uniref:DUF1330 domain-containing protein n=1 Tax=Trinickia violacea TaxID=2571746 RepID=A0A4P8IRP7_9BURK|nr:DUF1330 domain-containing protein [Trinickia violacea]QCP50861.1 DUF1330 domain-containing protein [Trinickia violacea]